MHINKAVKAAIYGAATLLPVTGAWALTPAQLAAVSTNNQLYIAGSTATDAALKAYFELDATVDSTAPCVSGTFDLYNTASGYILTCTTTAALGSVGDIAISKQTKGGSALGIHNVAAGVANATEQFPDLSAGVIGSYSGCTATAKAAVRPFAAYTSYACTVAENNTIIPNAGISDEDPQTWVGTGGVTNTDATAFTATGAAATHAVAVPFALVVSTALRNQLQTAEGLTSGSETLANVPSLTIAQARAIVTGQILDWGALWVWNSTTNKAAKVGNDTSSGVHVCRRGDTSGSQFAANIYLTGKGCLKGTGVAGISNPDDTTTQANGESWTGGTDTDGNNQPGDFFFAGAGTGDVLKCVGTSTLATGDTVNYRIGFASTDQVPIVAGVDAGWRYIAINGNAPTIWNIQQDKYDWITEDTFNYTATSLTANFGAAGNRKTIFADVAAGLSNLNSLTGLNAASQNAAATGDTSNGAADTGIVTLGNAVLFGANNAAGPSAPAWPTAIRSGSPQVFPVTAGSGPNNPLLKAYPGSPLNNCVQAFQGQPNGF